MQPILGRRHILVRAGHVVQILRFREVLIKGTFFSVKSLVISEIFIEQIEVG
jgi:hypothetical protein